MRMEKFHNKNLENIQKIFKEKTGVNVSNDGRSISHTKNKIILAPIIIVCVFSLLFIGFYGFKGSQGKGGEICREDYEKQVSTALSEVNDENIKEVEKGIKNYFGDLIYENWVWPTESEKISATYGVGINGIFLDHINIRGERSDAIYAVEKGYVQETGYKSDIGYYIVLELENSVTVKYGHLSKTAVKEGETVEAGDIVGEMGATGMAPGPNLYFAVYVDGSTVNPLQE